MAAVSPHRGLSQAFGIPAFFLHPQAMAQCIFSSSRKIWPVTIPRPRCRSQLTQRGGVGTWLCHWLPLWLKPRLGDIPVRPTLQWVVMPAHRRWHWSGIAQWVLCASPLWNPAHCCTLRGSWRKTMLLLSFLPIARTLRAPLSAVSTPKVAVQKGAARGSQHSGGERQPEWGGDSALLMRPRLKRRLHPWPDVLAGFGVSSVKNKLVWRRAGVGSCVRLQQDMLLLREAHGGTEKTDGFWIKCLLCCAWIISSCELMGGWN